MYYLVGDMNAVVEHSTDVHVSSELADVRVTEADNLFDGLKSTLGLIDPGYTIDDLNGYDHHTMETKVREATDTEPARYTRRRIDHIMCSTT